MDEILRHLGPGALVLDLGGGGGSFAVAGLPITAIRLDLEPRPSPAGGYFVAADAASLPFPDALFHAVIANHSLEHFVSLDAVLAEIRRVLRPHGLLYVSVPDASTFTDRVYRWMAAGGGHVNSFTSAAWLAGRIQGAIGLPHAATRPLYSSLNFLNRRHVRGWSRRKLIFFGLGYEPAIGLVTYVLRLADGLLHTRWSLYGWGLYFGRLPEAVDTVGWTNVCIRCGAAHPAAWLLAAGLVRRRFPGWRLYACPGCSASNLFTSDFP